MALNIPMPESPGDSLIKGLNSGSDLMHKLMLNKYYGQLHPSGDVANAAYVEELKNQYGADDPRYLEAKRAHDLVLQGHQSLIGYRDILNQTAGVRNSTTLGKTIAEAHGQGAQDIVRTHGKQGTGVNSGMSYDANGNNVVATPEEVAAAANGGQANNNGKTPEENEAYMRAINKQTSDEDARKRMRFAENLDITRKSINPENLTRYSGPNGTLNLIGEHLKSFKGNPSKEYLDYNDAVNSASLMAKQMRQFYGESIQTPAMKKLEELANPSTWYKNPKVAQRQWDSLNKILDKETGTYQKYGTSPIQLNGLEYKNGQFTLGKDSKASKNDDEDSNEGNEGGSYNFKAVVPQLLKIDPTYTEENIKSTAKAMNTTIDDVVNKLFQKSVKGK